VDETVLEDVSLLPERNLSHDCVRLKGMVSTKLPSEVSSNGTVLQLVAAVVNNMDSGSAANESNYVLDNNFSEQLLSVDEVEPAKCDNVFLSALEETRFHSVLPSLNHLPCENLPSNVKFEVDHSVESTACDGMSFSSLNGQPTTSGNALQPRLLLPRRPTTSGNALQPRLLLPRRKSTIYGTCKTNIQTEIYR